MVLYVQCGATTSGATWVLVADHDGGRLDAERDRVAVFEGGHVGVSWSGTALIVLHEDAKAFGMDRKAKGVAIAYQGE